MTTNEIAAAVQSGQADRMELWEAVRRFSYDRAYRWYRAMEGRGGMMLEDYIQVAFLALLGCGRKETSGTLFTMRCPWTLL